jgi:hypothetical protein
MLTPVKNVNLRISLHIFVKIWNGPNGVLSGPGETGVMKKILSKVENLVSYFSQVYATAQILESMLGKSHDFNAITLDDINHKTENFTFTNNGFALFFNYFFICV